METKEEMPKWAKTLLAETEHLQATIENLFDYHESQRIQIEKLEQEMLTSLNETKATQSFFLSFLGEELETILNLLKAQTVLIESQFKAPLDTTTRNDEDVNGIQTETSEQTLSAMTSPLVRLRDICEKILAKIQPVPNEDNKGE